MTPAPAGSGPGVVPCPRRNAGPIGDTGGRWWERWPAGGRPTLPDRVQAADDHRRGRAGCPNSLSINASDKLFGGADPRCCDSCGPHLSDRSLAADAHRRFPLRTN